MWSEKRSDRGRESLASSGGVALRQVGSVFGHAAGRRAFFNESGVGVNATGFGVVTPVGPTLFLPSEEGHYIYEVRIAVSGATGAASYVFRRRPWVSGAYEPGAGMSDSYDSSGNDTPVRRFVASGNTTRSNI